MDISGLLSHYQRQLQSVDNEFEAIKNISAIDIINDSNLKLSVTTSEDDLDKLSISQLNDKLNDNDNTLKQLNKLWIIKGLIQETTISLNPIEESTYRCDKFELQSIITNLNKFKQKLSQFDGSMIIINGLNDSYDGLLSNTSEQLVSIFDMIFPNKSTFVEKITINEVEITYSEFIQLCKDFEELDPFFSIKSLTHKLQLQWDTLLDQLINHEKGLKLEQQPNAYTLLVSDQAALFDRYCQSLIEFMNFINLFGNQSFKNFYSSKISNALTNKISENIKQLVNHDDSHLINILFVIIKLSKNTNWSLSIEKSLNSESDVNNKLHDLYLDWIVDKYINKLRMIYSIDFEKTIKNLHDEYSTEKPIKKDKQSQSTKVSKNNVENTDDWNEWDNDGWDDEVLPELESQPEQAQDEWKDDGWDQEEWDEKNHENQRPSSDKDKETQEKYKVSEVPNKLKRVIQEFQEESQNKDIRVLVSAIESLSIISYPSLNESFLLYNDLHFLNEHLEDDRLSKFLDINLEQCTQSFSNEVILILLSINLGHDDVVSDSINLSTFVLDNENESKLKLIDNWFNKMNSSNIKKTNWASYKKIISKVINLILNWLINSIVSMYEITEYQSIKLTSIIQKLQKIVNTNLILIDESNASVPSYNKLNNILFLINNHLKDIMDRFYQGEFFDLSTNELIAIIESIFIKSDLRDNYINEILDIRNVDN